MGRALKMDISRRDLLKLGLCSGLAVFSADHLLSRLYAASQPLKKALYFHPSGNGKVICDLCYHSCEIPSGKAGLCRSRINIGSELYTLTYGRPVAVHLDPIEKLPMRHVLPGESMLCIGTAGCNFSCQYCINHHVSQKSPKEVEAMYKTPEELVGMALRAKAPAVAFTYNEPTVAYELMYETFSLAKGKGLKTFFHSNGYMKPGPLKELLKITDGVVVDLKAFSPEAYSKLTGAGDAGVKDTLRLIHAQGCFLEIVNLLVPGYNDGPEGTDAISRFVAEELSAGVPLHFSRFFPKFRLSNLSPTPTACITKAVGTAKQKGLSFIYTNNIMTPQNNTYCPGCGEAVVRRQGTKVPAVSLLNGKCSFCGQLVPGIWKA